jgi:hypothetical protein
MPRVREELQLIAMEAVASVREDVREREHSSDAGEQKGVGTALSGSRHYGLVRFCGS